MSDVDDEGIGAVRAMAWSPLLTGVALSEDLDAEASAELLDRRRGVRDLGRAVRRVAEASVVSEVSTEQLRRARELINEAVGILGEQQRPSGTSASVDEPYTGLRMYSPMAGEGSPIIDPLNFEFDGRSATATCHLGVTFEGPPHHVHGGVSALLMDQALGYVVALAGLSGVTRELTIRYRAPVPIDTDLVVCSELVASGERDAWSRGWIARASAPDQRIVTADGYFRRLRPEQAGAMIGG